MVVFYVMLIFVALGFVLGRWYNPSRLTAPEAEHGLRCKEELLDILERNGWRYNETTKKVRHPVIANGQPMSITLAFQQLAYAGNQRAA